MRPRCCPPRSAALTLAPPPRAPAPPPSRRKRGGRSALSAARIAAARGPRQFGVADAPPPPAHRYSLIVAGGALVFLGLCGRGCIACKKGCARLAAWPPPGSRGGSALPHAQHDRQVPGTHSQGADFHSEAAMMSHQRGASSGHVL